jgi:DNA sulfur modification protein DndB
MQAIATSGARLMAECPEDWEAKLAGLRSIDWSRANRTLWDGRALVAGKVNRSRNNVVLVSNVISRALGVPLSAEAKRIEDLHAPATGFRMAS